MALDLETQSEDGHAVLSVGGEIDASTAPQLRETLAALVSSEQHIKIDLAGVTFIDSAGLHELQSAAMSMDGAGPLKVDNVSDLTLRVMGILGMTDRSDLEITGRNGNG